MAILLTISGYSSCSCIFLSFCAVFFFSFFSSTRRTITTTSSMAILPAVLLFSCDQLSFTPSTSSGSVSFLVPDFDISLSICLLISFMRRSPASSSSGNTINEKSYSCLCSPQDSSTLALISFPCSSSTDSNASWFTSPSISTTS